MPNPYIKNYGPFGLIPEMHGNEIILIVEDSRFFRSLISNKISAFIHLGPSSRALSRPQRYRHTFHQNKYRLTGCQIQLQTGLTGNSSPQGPSDINPDIH